MTLLAQPPDPLVDLVRRFFAALDESLDRLSRGQEGRTVDLPRWVLSSRQVRVGRVVYGAKPYYLVRAVGRGDVDPDDIELVEISDDAQLQAFNAPLQFNFPSGTPPPGAVWIYDWIAGFADDPLAPPIAFDPDLRVLVGTEQFAETFSERQAKEMAIDLWNQAVHRLAGYKSFVEGLRGVFDRFAKLIRRKSFVERRIHRFINEHRRFLLPDHRRCLFEHDLVLGDERRRADFILERDAGLPTLLIELETPATRIFTKRGEPTKETNHARGQIAEWVRFIDEDPRNTAGDLALLRGPKDRLVVISTGLDQLDQMLTSRYTDTTLWTYDLLLREAKVRWDGVLKQQRVMLGLPDIRRFF